MKYSFLIFAALSFSGCVGTQNYAQMQRYNYLSKEHEIARPDEVLKWNYMDKMWTYESADTQLKYNYLESRHEWSR